MTDAELVAKKLAALDTYLHQLHTLAHIEILATDVKEERFVCHTLQLAIQAVLDVASHIVSDGHLGEPHSLGGLFGLLARDGWIDAGLATRLRRMAGFRNLLVHEYGTLDLAIVCDIVAHRLGDLAAFARGVRSRLP